MSTKLLIFETPLDEQRFLTVIGHFYHYYFRWLKSLYIASIEKTNPVMAKHDISMLPLHCYTFACNWQPFCIPQHPHPVPTTCFIRIVKVFNLAYQQHQHSTLNLCFSSDSYCKCFCTGMQQTCMFLYGCYKLLGLCSMAAVIDASGTQCCICVYVKYTQPLRQSSITSHPGKLSLFYSKSSPGPSHLSPKCCLTNQG